MSMTAAALNDPIRENDRHAYQYKVGTLDVPHLGTVLNKIYIYLYLSNQHVKALRLDTDKFLRKPGQCPIKPRLRMRHQRITHLR